MPTADSLRGTSPRRRVVITGIGAICPIGTHTEEFWQSCLQARSAISPIPPHWLEYADYQSTIWSPLPEVDYAARGLTRAELLQHDPVSLLGMCAAQEALHHARLDTPLIDRRNNTYRIAGLDTARAGVFMGTGIGGAHSFLANHAHQVLARRRRELAALANDVASAGDSRLADTLDKLVHPPRFHPLVVSMLMPNAVAAALGIKFSLKGPCLTHSLACAAGTAAVGYAFRAVKAGDVDFALAGGAEYLNDYYGGIFRGFDAANTLVRDCERPERANRPFDKKRSGFLFSQGGAAVLVLEELGRAMKREAPLIAEVSGYAETFDAYSMMAMAPDGAQMERAVRLALEDAQTTPRDIDYVNAHGTGTQMNDPIECEVIERVFGKSVRLNSTKSLVGHTIGASGALEAVVTALSLKHQITHACKNLDDPIADLNFVRSAEPSEMFWALSQSFAFGGHNAVLVLRRIEG